MFNCFCSAIFVGYQNSCAQNRTQERTYTMQKLNEHEVFAAAAGILLNPEKLNRIATHNGHGWGDYADCEEYYVGCLENMEEELIRKFRITDILLERWNLGGILFRICLYVRDGKLTGGHIFKYKDTTASCHFRPTGYAMSPTQQEIRIANRILRYLTEEDA